MGSYLYLFCYFPVREMSNNPYWLRLLSIMTMLFFIIFKLYFENNSTQSSSQSWPIDIRDPVARSSKIYLCCASFDKCGERFICVCAFCAMMLPFSTLTFGPNTGVVLSQYSVAASSK